MARPHRALPALARGRRRLLALSAGGLVGLWLSGCRSAARPAPGQEPANRLLVPTAAPGQLIGVLPSAELAVGENNRFLLGLIDDQNRPVRDAQVHLRFFKRLGERSAQMRSETPAVYRGSPQLGDHGLYVARVGFDEPGSWGVEVQATRPDGRNTTLRLGFEVLAQTKTPPVGSQAPASQTPVALAPAEVERICSARPVDDFHRLSIAEALAQSRPLVVLFATPAFCATRVCGPSLEVVQEATSKHLGRLNVIHVEIYQDAHPPDLVPAVAEWSLPSEPWVFLIGADGRIVDKFEGGITVDELAPAVARLAQA